MGSVEAELAHLTDSEILLNFRAAIAKLYPHLIPILAHAYDAWDEISERLFFAMTYDVFASKYGIPVAWEHHHVYASSAPSYRKLHHIECRPTRTRLSLLRTTELSSPSRSERLDLSDIDLEDKIIVFSEFGDGRHWLPGGLSAAAGTSVNFDLVGVELAFADSGQRCPEPFAGTFWTDPTDVSFEFVAEDLAP